MAPSFHIIPDGDLPVPTLVDIRVLVNVEEVQVIVHCFRGLFVQPSVASTCCRIAFS